MVGEAADSEDIYKLKLIDFANVLIPGKNNTEDTAKADEDLIKGVSNLLQLLEALISNPHILDDYILESAPAIKKW